ERAGHTEVAGAEGSFSDVESALEERLGIGIAAFPEIEHGQVIQGCRDVGMVGAKRLLADRQQSLGQRYGFGEFSRSKELSGFLIECCCLVLLPKGRHGDGDSYRRRE